MENNLRNTEQNYGKMTIVIHWLMALLVIGMIAAGFIMDELDKPLKESVEHLHMAIGVIVLLLALFRWYWTLTNTTPKPVEGLTKAEIGVSHGSKWLLLLALIGLPVSGALMVMFSGSGIEMFGLFDIPSFFEKNKGLRRLFHEVHEIGGYVIAAIVILHVAAAFKHHFISKNNVLNRMLGR